MPSWVIETHNIRRPTMIVHQREIGYSKNYAAFFEALTKAKAYMEEKHPEVAVTLMYNLAGKRGRAIVQTQYASLADYERIDAEMDKDESYARLFEPIMSGDAESPVDQFYRVI
jgi:hypothetical protein